MAKKEATTSGSSPIITIVYNVGILFFLAPVLAGLYSEEKIYHPVTGYYFESLVESSVINVGLRIVGAGTQYYDSKHGKGENGLHGLLSTISDEGNSRVRLGEGFAMFGILCEAILAEYLGDAFTTLEMRSIPAPFENCIVTFIFSKLHLHRTISLSLSLMSIFMSGMYSKKYCDKFIVDLVNVLIGALVSSLLWFSVKIVLGPVIRWVKKFFGDDEEEREMDKKSRPAIRYCCYSMTIVYGVSLIVFLIAKAFEDSTTATNGNFVAGVISDSAPLGIVCVCRYYYSNMNAATKTALKKRLARTPEPANDENAQQVELSMM